MATSVSTQTPLRGVDPEPERALRLEMMPRGLRPGLLDGAWWPYSRDLARELPALLAVLDPALGRITHATVHRAAWPEIPAQVPVPGHVLRLGWYDVEQDADTIALFSYTVGRWDLLVVPPEAAPDAAAWAMDAACTADDTQTASELLAVAQSRSAQPAVKLP